jgi:Family of unknown function (DUF5519)
MERVSEQIRREVTSWEGVRAEPHRFGGVEFRVAGHEIGHLHGERLADLPFPRRVRDALVADGRALPHHVLSDTGWVSVPLRSAGDVPAALELFRMNYDRVTSATHRRASADASAAGASTASSTSTASIEADDGVGTSET